MTYQMKQMKKQMQWHDLKLSLSKSTNTLTMFRLIYDENIQLLAYLHCLSDVILYNLTAIEWCPIISWINSSSTLFLYNFVATIDLNECFV